MIDLSADFRVKDIPLWKNGMVVSTLSSLGRKSGLCLPELNREAMKKAQLIAAPGCYPTSVQLGFLPLLEAGILM